MYTLLKKTPHMTPGSMTMWMNLYRDLYSKNNQDIMICVAARGVSVLQTYFFVMPWKHSGT